MGLLSNSETGERGSCSLEGGLTSLPEGLRDSESSCAQCLSVPGFFAIPRRFPGWKRFILRGEREVSARKRPFLFNPVTKSVNPGSVAPSVLTNSETGMRGREAMYTYLGMVGGHIQGSVHPPWYPGRHMDQGIPHSSYP